MNRLFIKVCILIMIASMITVNCIFAQTMTLNEEKDADLTRYRARFTDAELAGKLIGKWQGYGASVNGRTYYSSDEMKKENAAEAFLNGSFHFRYSFFCDYGRDG